MSAEMSKHTPGPWMFDEDDLHIYADGTPVASVYGPDDFPCVDDDDPDLEAMRAETKANGFLVQAAPELLEAAQALSSAVRNLEGQPIQYSLEKAEGRES